MVKPVPWPHGLLTATTKGKDAVTKASSDDPLWHKDLTMASHKDKETSSAFSLLFIQANMDLALPVFSHRLQNSSTLTDLATPNSDFIPTSPHT